MGLSDMGFWYGWNVIRALYLLTSPSPSITASYLEPGSPWLCPRALLAWIRLNLTASHRAVPAGHVSPWLGAASLAYQHAGGVWANSSTCPSVSSLAEPRTSWGSRRRYVLLLVPQWLLSLISGERNFGVVKQMNFASGAFRGLGCFWRSRKPSWRSSSDLWHCGGSEGAGFVQ